jgi:thiamine biosynthesis protein ThiI
MGEILFEETGTPVKLKLPDLNFEIEIGEDGIYLFTEKIRGYGGMPYGSAGKLGVLFSGGIDSPVAAFLMMKRGVEPVLIHYRITDQEVEKVKLLRDRLEEYSVGKSIKLIIIDRNELFKGKFSKIYNNKRLQPFVCVMCKFLMHSRAAKVAEEENLLGIITGDNLAQVATQTLKNLFAYRTVSKLPVYSPLISFDKIDIIEIARDIGTYEISILKTEACVPPKNPKTGVSSQIFKKIMEEADIHS